MYTHVIVFIIEHSFELCMSQELHTYSAIPCISDSLHVDLFQKVEVKSCKGVLQYSSSVFRGTKMVDIFIIRRDPPLRLIGTISEKEMFRILHTKFMSLKVVKK